MPLFARVAVNVPAVRDAFDYQVPDAFQSRLTPGWLVEVPFSSQMVQGIVLSLEKSSSVNETRPISQVLEDAPVLTTAQLQLGQWLAQQYFTPVSAYLFAMLPPGLGQRADTLFELNPQAPANIAELSPLQQKIFDLLKSKGALRARQLDRAFAHVDWRAAVRSLGRQGYLHSQPLLPKPAVKARQIRSVRALIPISQIESCTSKLGRPESAAHGRRLAALRLLARENKEVDVSWVYAACGAAADDLRFLEKQ